jgi:hypothetical protein
MNSVDKLHNGKEGRKYTVTVAMNYDNSVCEQKQTCLHEMIESAVVHTISFNVRHEAGPWVEVLLQSKALVVSVRVWGDGVQSKFVSG